MEDLLRRRDGVVSARVVYTRDKMRDLTCAGHYVHGKRWAEPAAAFPATSTAPGQLSEDAKGGAII